MEMLSAEYGWTPSQIKNESNEDMLAYIEVINNKRLIEKSNLKKNGR